MSRHGIVATGEEVRKLIFRGLAGGDSEDDCIDLTEVMAILLIPYLVKVVQDQDDTSTSSTNGLSINSSGATNKDDDTKDIFRESLFAWERETLEAAAEERLQMRTVHASIISNVLDMILLDCCGSSTPPPLTKDLLRTIFSYYKEEDLILDDDLLDEMIDCACAGGEINPEDAVLDAKTFARALTNDVQLYNPQNEFRMSTHFEDAFGLDRHEGESEYIGSARSTNPLENDTQEDRSSTEKDQHVVLDLNAGAGVGADTADYKQERKVRAVATLSQIDFMADNFRSSIQYVVRASKSG
jgi:hypothetical protein